MNPPLRKIGFFGGSFNPVHTAHMQLAQWIVGYTALDGVWLSPAARNPLKESGGVDDAHRMAMLRLACEDTPGVEPTDVELSLPSPSYTAATLCHLASAYPHIEFTLIIGSDNWLIFDRWRESEWILANHRVMIYPRPGFEIDKSALPPGVSFLSDAPVSNLSSSFLRSAIADRICVSQFLPGSVYSYIMQHKLYTK